MTLTVQHLSKRYAKQLALNDINLRLTSGVVALLGANGSGKSTLLRLLATLDKPDNGTIQWFGLEYESNLPRLRQIIGYLPQSLDLPDDLTPFTLLQYLAHMRHASLDGVDTLIHQLSLQHVSHKHLRELSGGQTRLVGIAQAYLGRPQLLLLDEPGNGLDIVERQRLYRLLSGQKRLTIFSTHAPDEAERLARFVIILHHGKILFQGAVDDLKYAMRSTSAHHHMSLEEAYLALMCKTHC